MKAFESYLLSLVLKTEHFWQLLFSLPHLLFVAFQSHSFLLFLSSCSLPAVSLSPQSRLSLSLAPHHGIWDSLPLPLSYFSSPPPNHRHILCILYFSLQAVALSFSFISLLILLLRVTQVFTEITNKARPLSRSILRCWALFVCSSALFVGTLRIIWH